MPDLSDIPLPELFVVTTALIIGVFELAVPLGRRRRERGGDDIGGLESATLGMLALMIGFTFAMALARFDARRDAVLNEANAIGTTALRARLLPAPYNRQSLDLLREYTALRLEAARVGLQVDEQRVALDRSGAIHEALWQQARAVATINNGMVPTGLFIQTLNDMIDNHEKRLTAARNRVPASALWGLYGITIVAMAFMGYDRGLRDNRVRAVPWTMGIMIAGVILLIQDLDRPTAGFIRVSEQPMIDTAASLASYKD